ncbi:MAG TPA: sodium:solute symporter family protein [Candidatus Bathyarchaeia archaeon]|nr:sodium:solute symporter family protein [Candidatus Bathyarchaeia archaeon]
MAGGLITWGIIIAYMIFIFFKGVLKARKIRDTDDFLVAGRNIGWFFLFCTMGATVIGGGSSIGAIGRTYEWGVLMLVVSTGWYLHFLFSGLVVAPKFRDAELYTVAGYFGHRFGEGPRFLVLILSLLFSVFIVAAQMAAFGSVLTAILPEFTNSPLVLALAIIIGGAVVVTYSTAGGLLAVIHTDVYQFVILIFGFLVTLAACIPDIISSWKEATSAIPHTFFQIEGGKGWIFLVTTFLAFFLGETFAPGYATRYCVGKDIRETRIGIAGVGIFLALTFPVVLFFIALYARIHFPDIAPQQALPMVIRKMNNPVIGGLVIGALMMAVMSSADSALNSSTAIFIKDLFEHQLGWKDRNDGRMLRLARICSALLGGAAILVAVLWSDIIGLLLFTYHLWAPAIILPVCVGVLSKKRSPALTRNIFITMLTASALTMIYKGFAILKNRLDIAPLGDGAYRFMEQVDASVFGVAVSCLTFGVLTFLTTDRNAIAVDPEEEQPELSGSDD